jgi:hypothetical protein
MPHKPVQTNLSITPVDAPPAGGRDADVFVGPAVFLSGLVRCADLRAVRGRGWP